MANDGKRPDWLTGERAEARPFVRGYQVALLAAATCSLLDGPIPITITLFILAALLLGIAIGKSR